VNLVSTELNQRIASAVRHAVAAERSRNTGQAVFWRCIGVGLICFGLGGATGISFYGYAKLSRDSDNLTSLSKAFAEALAKATLKGSAEGTVRVEPSEIRLAKGQTISVDPSSTLHLDPDAKVAVDGEIRVQLPAPTPATSEPQAGPRSPNPPSITNFTVFKHVPFQKGTVMTGWEFLTSKQRMPTSQYCYYTEDSNDPGSDLPGLSVVVHLGLDQRVDAPKSVPKNFDVAAAFARCVWFGG
jgi:hypothetical protein